MREEARKRLEKAERSIAAARTLLEHGDADFSIARGYYALLYVAEALLVERGLRFRKHGGVHGAFGEHFAKTGVMEAKFHRWLIDTFDLRSTADYGLDVALTHDDAALAIARAEEFLAAARGFLEAG